MSIVSFSVTFVLMYIRELRPVSVSLLVHTLSCSTIAGIQLRVYNYVYSVESRMIVTGPSLVNEQLIIAPNWPSLTLSAPSVVFNRSRNWL